MRYLIIALIMMIAAPAIAADYTAITPDNTVTDRNAVQVQVATQTENSEVRTLQYLLTQVAVERAKRDAAIDRLRELADEIALVEAVVDTVELRKSEEEPELPEVE